MTNIKITGEWDGKQIWREKTPEEKLLEALELPEEPADEPLIVEPPEEESND